MGSALAENAFSWSVTASDNDDADAAVPWPEGMLPGSVNNSARGVMAAVARFIKDMNGTISTTGVPNAYLLTSSSDHVAYTNGILITAKASFSNTDFATLNLNSFGAKKIRVFGIDGEGDIKAGQIRSGSTYQFRYDTSLDSANGAFLLLNPTLLAINVGDIKIWPSDTLETGWLWCNGDSQVRADLPELFAIIGTTYGAVDGSHFNLPDLRGRAPFGSDDMGASAAGRITNAVSGITGATLGAAGGAESITLDTTQIPSHQHTGLTESENAQHTHAGTSGTESADHSHTTPVGTQPTQVFGGGGPAYIALTTGSGTNITGSGKSATHTHLTTTGNENATHAHDFTTNLVGGGLAHRNLPPLLICNYVIKY